MRLSDPALDGKDLEVKKGQKLKSTKDSAYKRLCMRYIEILHYVNNPFYPIPT